jgi:hypothetical protein
MYTLPVTPLHPSASLGGYEWRAQELLDELAAASEAQKPYILNVLSQVTANFHRVNPGRPFVPCRSPFAPPVVATQPYRKPVALMQNG